VFDHDEYHRSMPPRKKVAVQPALSAAVKQEFSSSDDSYDSACEFMRNEFDADDVVDQVSVLECLPTMTLIALAAGVCVRLQTVLASLAHKPGIIGHGAGGHRRVLRDAIRIESAARAAVTAALNELLAVEVVLKRSRVRSERMLQEADD
jgi:hypothetical protein